MSRLHPGDDVDEVVEFATFIRERPVACRWSAGEVTGDPELLDRMSHVVMADGWADHPSSVAKAISAAIGSSVSIRVVRNHEIDLSDQVRPVVPDDLRDVLTDMVTDTDADVLGDYWLG